MAIKKRTVLILGAGASQHLGYPLGYDLVKKIQSIHYDDEERQNVKNLITSLHQGGGSIDALDDSYALTFISNLNDAQPSSIDEYLSSHTSDHDVATGKLLIARELTKHEDLKILHETPGWYYDLLQAIKPIDGLGDSFLSIVTFNYDISLETYLFKAFKQTYHGDQQHAVAMMSKIPFIHLYGDLGDYLSIQYRSKHSPDRRKIATIVDRAVFATALYERSQNIHTMHERSVTDDFKHADRLLSLADRVFFLGFGYDETNLSRFEYFTADLKPPESFGGTLLETRRIDYQRIVNKIRRFGLGDSFIKSDKDCNSFFHESFDLES
jgi:hypothetical protein